MSPIIWLLILVFIIGPIAWYLVNRNIEKQHIKTTAENVIREILRYSKMFAENLSSEFHLDYNSVLFEEIIFFYFLHVVKIVNQNMDDEICDYVQKHLFSSFNQSQALGFTTNNIFTCRKKDYNEILSKHDLKLSTAFYSDIFEYQASKLDYKNKDAIKNSLMDNIELIRDFYKSF